MKPLFGLAAALLLFANAPATAQVALQKGDRVVWLGGTLVEREGRYGHWESALSARHPDAGIIFRNLGWSADTVWGEARAGFGTPETGYNQLVTLTLALKPTLIILNYGQVEAFEGQAGLAKFVKQYAKLIDDLSEAKARIVLLSPVRAERNAQYLPDAAPLNAKIDLYRAAIANLAAEKKLPYVDWQPVWDEAVAKSQKPLTDNGLHPTEEGYRRTAQGVANLLSPLRSAAPYSEKLRETIAAKNELYFHRWRPQNQTYLFGFRKHEQGRNAAEIVQFDPLIEAKEGRIAELLKANKD